MSRHHGFSLFYHSRRLGDRRSESASLPQCSTCRSTFVSTRRNQSHCERCIDTFETVGEPMIVRDIWSIAIILSAIIDSYTARPKRRGLGMQGRIKETGDGDGASLHPLQVKKEKPH